MEKNPYTEKPVISRKGDEITPRRPKRTADYYLLWLLVLILLAFNLALGWYLVDARQQVLAYREVFSTRLVQAGTILENIKSGSIEYNASIDQVIPISVNIPLDYVVQVPINMVVPIDTTISIPLLGETGPTIDVPVSMEVPISTTVRVPINMSVPINADMPIKMDVPVSIKMSDTFLAGRLDETQVLLAQLTLDLGDLFKLLFKAP